MKKIILLVCLLLPCSLSYAYDLTLKDTSVSVYFSPRGGAQDALVAAIGHAQESIYVQAYSFTSAPIARALVDAHNRGIRVEAVLDRQLFRMWIFTLAAVAAVVMFRPQREDAREWMRGRVAEVKGLPDVWLSA